MTPWTIDVPLGWAAAIIAVVWLTGAVISIALRDPNERNPR